MRAIEIVFGGVCVHACKYDIFVWMGTDVYWYSLITVHGHIM